MYSFRPMSLPNVPDPVNGMIKTYDTTHRTFSRPFSAKTVFFYKDGDEHFTVPSNLPRLKTGVRMPVSKSRYRNIDSLLDDLNTSLYMPFGVRRLTTPMGRTNIENINQLQHMGKYVATSSKFPRGINLSALERIAKARQAAHIKLSRQTDGGQSYWVPTSPSYKQKLRMSRTLGLNFVPSKQIFFVLSGASTMYRTLLNPMRLPTMETLLKEISEGLGVAVYRLYTIEGQRVIHVNEMINLSPPKVFAVPRHGKLVLKEPQRFTLPPINTNPVLTRTGTFTKSARSMKTNGTTLTSITYSSSNNSASNNENLIEKPRTAIRKQTRKTTGAPKKKKIIPLKSVPRKVVRGAAAVVASGIAILPRLGKKNDDEDSGKATSTTSSRNGDKRPEIEEDDTSSDYPEVEVDSKMINKDFIREEHEERFVDEEDLIQDDDESIDIRPKLSSRPRTQDTDPESEQPDTENEEKMDHRNREMIKEEEEDEFFEEKSVSRQEPKRQRTIDTDLESEQPDTEDERGRTANTELESEQPDTDDERNEDTEDEGHGRETDLESDQPDTEDEMGIDTELEDEQPETTDDERMEEVNNNEEGEDQFHVSHTPRPINAPSPLPRSSSSEDGTRPGTKEDDEMKNEDDEGGNEEGEWSDVHHEAATKIQARIRGHLERKKLRFMQSPMDGEVMGKEEEIGEDEVEKKKEEEKGASPVLTNDSPLPSTQSEPIPSYLNMTYTISVLTGNRWGGDSEVNLFVTLYGDERNSDKFLLAKNDHDSFSSSSASSSLPSSWLQSDTPKHRQNQLDSFHVDSPVLGTLHKIVIGHDSKGYGAGIYIEHILVTENVVDGRQFIFFCSKWFDSGQVDGKILRTLPLSAFYYISSIPSDASHTQGRWEFIFHNGMQTGEGGTSSNLTIVGFGTSGSSVTLIENDSSLQKVPSTSLIQVDFGNIGDLIKVRIEIDGKGDNPDYYLEYVEMRDLDTEERLAVRVSNWLDISGSKTKRPQSFRELSVFRAGTAPLSVMTYEGKVTVGDDFVQSGKEMHGQVVGEYSDSGVFPMTTKEEDKKGEYSFKFEAVYLGRVTGIKTFTQLTHAGEAIFEGLGILQDLWEKRGLTNVGVAEKLVSTSAWVRESTHCPYRYRLENGHVQEMEDTVENKENGLGSQKRYKRLNYDGMKGLSTRNKKDQKTTPEHETDVWELGMSFEHEENVEPIVSIVVGQEEYRMNRMNKKGEEGNGLLMHFELFHSPPLGRVDKVRVGIHSHLVPKGTIIHIHKIRLVNAVTNEQIRYPKADSFFSPGVVIEFPAVYPDLPPKPAVIYTIAIETHSKSGDFIPFLQVVGEDSNTGWRRVPTEDVDLSDGASDQFDIEAVDVGTLKKMTIRLDGVENSVTWSGTIKTSTSTAPTQYMAQDITISGLKEQIFNLNEM